MRCAKWPKTNYVNKAHQLSASSMPRIIVSGHISQLLQFNKSMVGSRRHRIRGECVKFDS